MNKKRHILTVEVDEQTYNTLIDLAKSDDRSYGYVVRKVLKTFLSHNQSNLVKPNLIGTGDVGA